MVWISVQFSFVEIHVCFLGASYLVSNNSFISNRRRYPRSTHRYFVENYHRAIMALNLKQICNFSRVLPSVASLTGHTVYSKLELSRWLGIFLLHLIVCKMIHWKIAFAIGKPCNYSFLPYRPTTNAVMALTVSNYMIQPFFGEEDLPKSASTLLAAVFICGLTWLNCYSMKVTTRLQNVFMVTKVVALLLVICVGIYALSQGRSI